MPPPASNPERPRAQAVHAVGPDHDRCSRRTALEADDPRGRVELGRLDAVSELHAGVRGLLRQECIEPPPLRHQHERPLPAPLEPPPVAEAELEAVDDVLHDRVNRKRQLPHGPVGQAAAAGLVPRKPLPVEHQHARAAAGEPQRRRRTRRPRAHHDGVKPLHARNRTSLEPQQPPQ